MKYPDEKGFYGKFGGQFVPPQLMLRLKELEDAYNKFKDDKDFINELNHLLNDYVGRPSPLYFAKRLTEKYNCKIYFKREDLNHTGAHKINNTIGQALLAKKMGKRKIIAETGAGQHGVATATACSLLNLDCEIFMGEFDANKQRINVQKIKLLGAKINIVKNGTLKEAVDKALEHYIKDEETFYLLGSVVGPHPYPMIVRNFQKIIGEEAKQQILDKENKLPDYLVACIGGGSNAMGLFYNFLKDNVKMIAVEPAGKGLNTIKHSATLTLGSLGLIHGFKCYLLQDDTGNPLEVYSIASGLDYPGVGPEPCLLKDNDKVFIETISDEEALNAFHETTISEGIFPALETCHALAYAFKLAEKVDKEKIIVVNFSGRGDKDIEFIIN